MSWSWDKKYGRISTCQFGFKKNDSTITCKQCYVLEWTQQAWWIGLPNEWSRGNVSFTSLRFHYVRCNRNFLRQLTGHTFHITQIHTLHIRFMTSYLHFHNFCIFEIMYMRFYYHDMQISYCWLKVRLAGFDAEIAQWTANIAMVFFYLS